MASPYRTTADRVSQALTPRLPTDFEKGGGRWAQELTRALDLWLTVILGIQDAGTKMPIRAWLDFEGASLTDDPDNDRIQVSIAGGAGAAPKNASYIVVGLNGVLTAERTYANGTGISSADGGAGGNFTVSLDTSSTRNTDHAGVTLTAGTGLTGGGDITSNRSFNLANTAVTPGAYGSATQVATFTVDQQGRLTIAGNTAITYPTPTIVGSAFTVATLPVAPAQGTRAWVTDATAPTFLAALVGGGAVVCPAFYDGASWVAA